LLPKTPKPRVYIINEKTVFCCEGSLRKYKLATEKACQSNFPWKSSKRWKKQAERNRNNYYTWRRSPYT